MAGKAIDEVLFQPGGPSGRFVQFDSDEHQQVFDKSRCPVAWRRQIAPLVLPQLCPRNLPKDGPDLLGRWGAGTEIGTALFWDRAL
jgi:hypothetical protein